MLQILTFSFDRLCSCDDRAMCAVTTVLLSINHGVGGTQTQHHVTYCNLDQHRGVINTLLTVLPGHMYVFLVAASMFQIADTSKNDCE